MRLSLWLFCCGLALGGARGAPLERDLGGGLIYDRVRHVPADLPPSPPAGPARRSTVLDLRYAQSAADATNALAAWLKSSATARTPVFILANAETDPSLLALLARHEPNDGILLLGSPSPGFAPNIAVKTTPEAERRAYDAFDTQADLLALLKENASKFRNDEARLSRDHLSPTAGEDLPADNPAASETKTSTSSAPPAPPVDYVLQRALHLHRALLALKKI